MPKIEYSTPPWKTDNWFIKDGRGNVVCIISSSRGFRAIGNSNLIKHAPVLLVALKIILIELDTHIAKYPVMKTKLPDLRVFIQKHIHAVENLSPEDDIEQARRQT